MTNKKSNIILIILFLLLVEEIKTQIPINRFYKFNEYSTAKNYNNFYLYDYDKDGFEDVFLLGNKTTSIIVHKSEIRPIISESFRKVFSYPINGLEPIFINSSISGSHIFISSTEKRIGLLSIDNNANFQLVSQTKLDSRPDYIVTDKYGQFNRKRSIVFGNNFNGISLITVNNLLINQRKLVENKIFPFAVFYDINYDNHSDIIAFNKINRNIEFYFSDLSLDYNHYRSINVNRNITDLKVMDFNNDGYGDILYSFSNKINIVYGDAVSPYENSLIIETQNNIDKFQLEDLNNDGFLDIIYENKNSIFVMFAKNIDSYWEEILYENSDNKAAITILKRSSNIHLLSYYNDGKIYSYSQLKNKQSQFTIKLSPDTHSSLFYMNDNKENMAVLDSTNKKITIVSNFTQPESKYYSINLSQNYTNIFHFNNYLITYSNESKWIDIIKIVNNIPQRKVNRVFIGKYINDIKSEKDKIIVIASLFDNLETKSIDLINFIPKTINTKNIINKSKNYFDNLSNDIINIIQDSTNIYLSYLTKEMMHQFHFRDYIDKLIFVNFNLFDRKDGYSLICKEENDFVITSNKRQVRISMNKDKFNYDINKSFVFRYQDRNRFFIYNNVNNNMLELKIIENKIQLIPKFTYPVKSFSVSVFNSNERFFILTNRNNNSIAFIRTL